MAIFGNKRRSQVVEPVETPQRRKSLFGRRSVSPTRNGTVATNGHSNGGLFNRHRSTSPRATTTTTTHSTGGLLHRHNEDPAVSAARERVTMAETAERDADRALLNARTAVRHARDEVKRLEREAAEEYVILNYHFWH